MQYLPQMIIIGSNAKNSGKTWLSTFLIKKFSTQYNIIGIKAKFLYSSSDFVHFNTQFYQQNGYEIYREQEFSAKTDTSKMLVAGACCAYFVQSQIDVAQQCIDHLLTLIPPKYLVICESNEMINWVDPSLFVVCSSSNPINLKNNIDTIFSKADKIIYSDGSKFDFDVNRIVYSEKEQSWIIR